MLIEKIFKKIKAYSALQRERGKSMWKKSCTIESKEKYKSSIFGWKENEYV